MTTLAAVVEGVPLPVEVGTVAAVVALLGYLVRWLIARTDRTDAQHVADAAEERAGMLERISALEAKVAYLEGAVSQERSAKHDAMGRAASAVGTLKVVRHLNGVLGPEEFHAAVPRLLHDLELFGERRWL